jgi:hypothetical protein
MRGQLYRIPITHPGLLFDENPHNPAGDPVVDDEDYVRGFVMAREGDDMIILLFKPNDKLPPKATVMKEECSFNEELDFWVAKNLDLMVEKMEAFVATATPVGQPENN